MSSEPVFEDGKQLEDYVAELDSLKIEPEPNPEATQVLETVVEEPVRNKKEKPKPPQQQVPVKQSLIQKPVEAEVPKAEVKPVPEKPVDQPTVQPQEPQPTQDQLPQQPQQQETPSPQVSTPIQPQRPAINSLDDYIQFNAEKVRQQYYEAGDIASQQYLQSTYDKFLAIADGRVQLVPAQQEQPQPEEAVESDIDVLRKIEFALTVPDLSLADKKLLMKRRCEILSIPFDESQFIEKPKIVAVEVPAEPVASVSPVDSKKVKDEPLKKKKGLSPKLVLCGVALAALVTIAVVLLIGALTH